MKRLFLVFLGLCAAFALFSYGFVDPNFPYFHSSQLAKALTYLVYQIPAVAAATYVVLLVGLFVAYKAVLTGAHDTTWDIAKKYLIVLGFILIVSYPSLSYDIFNYIATAKVTFRYHENPYVVMPIEISNEPMLAYTRAANKLALYGPTWIVLTSFPHLLGQGNLLATIFSFKLFVAFFYAALICMIIRITKRWDQALFFALNPLVLVEVLVSGHNDVVMMTLAIAGLLLWHRYDTFHKLAGIILFAASVLVKGATIVLLPLFFFPALKWERKVVLGYVLMFGVFLLSPLREEMYPWYAIWWLAFAAFVPMKKSSFIHNFSFWMSLGLMLRYVPWIATRSYGVPIPMLRAIVTVVPAGLYVLYAFRVRIRQLLRLPMSGGLYGERKKK